MTMQEAKTIWFNGSLIPWKDANVHVLSHAMHYGSGAFEGMRAYEIDGRAAIVGLDAHVQRLFDSCRVLYMDLPFTPEQVSAGIRDTIKSNGHTSCYIRPLAFRGYAEIGVVPDACPVELAIASFTWGAYHGTDGVEKGVDVGVSSWRRMAPDTHPAMAKVAGNYVNSMLVVMEARRHGYAEGIVLDTAGYVSEGSGENLFFVKDGALLTPALGDSILPGITRGYVIDLCKELGLEVRETRIVREMMYSCDEMFMTGTAAEITPVRSVDRHTLGDGKPGEITKQLQDEYFSILHGRKTDRHGWLTFVESAQTGEAPPVSAGVGQEG
ncbi:branched chain amino acid aminotransferase [Candidatus Woesearchaeota archaeon]|nr:branched chain amino acid aminotransferase [Candidatus Woesearchaeota archaeon]